MLGWLSLGGRRDALLRLHLALEWQPVLVLDYVRDGASPAALPSVNELLLRSRCFRLLRLRDVLGPRRIEPRDRLIWMEVVLVLYDGDLLRHLW